MRRLFSSVLLSSNLRRSASTPHIFSPHLAPPRPAPLMLVRDACLPRQQRFLNNTSSEELSGSLSNEAHKGMLMEVEVTSKENIKPTSPTPLHLRTYNLSGLDQLYPHVYNSFVFFYPNNLQTTSLTDLTLYRSKKLKQSLSETLTRFYPFAGKIKDALYIDCSDEGVYYVETRVKHSLSKFLSQPNNQLIHRLLPHNPNSMDSISESYVIMVQVNIFDCGGIAISMCTSHKIIDGQSYLTFLKAWAATARGSCEHIYPSFIAQSYFPQNLSLPKNSTVLMWPVRLSKCVTRRFVFDATAIAALKAKTFAQNPSRSLAVMTLICKCAMATSTTINGSQRPSVFTIPVNFRRKSSPPLSQYSIGNIFWNAVAQFMPNTELGLNSMVARLKNAIAKIDSGFVEGIKGDKGCVKVSECLEELREAYSDQEADYYVVSSLCNAGVYEVDFGWGKPVWSCMGNGSVDIPVLINIILLMDTRSGDGVEVWVTLSEQDMGIFERDPELLSFASLDPSPLKRSDPVSHFCD